MKHFSTRGSALNWFPFSRCGSFRDRPLAAPTRVAVSMGLPMAVLYLVFSLSCSPFFRSVFLFLPLLREFALARSFLSAAALEEFAIGIAHAPLLDARGRDATAPVAMQLCTCSVRAAECLDASASGIAYLEDQESK